MAFTKDFFAELDAHIEEYRKHFWTNVVTVSIKAYQREFNLKRLVQCGDDLLTFAYCDAAKQRELPDKVQEEIGETHAFPALTVPYGAVLWVELNPGKADGSLDGLGFQPKKK